VGDPPHRDTGSRTDTYVPLDTLRPALFLRSNGVDKAHVRLLAEIETGLPPILVHRSSMRVIDGMHRLAAARFRGQELIEVTYFDGSECDSFVLAVEANLKHGLPLTLSDRKRSAARIIESYPEWSDRAISAKVGLSPKTVASVRRDRADHTEQSAGRIGQDGRMRPLSGAEGRARAAAVLAENPGATLREIARAAGISLGTAKNVRDRISRGGTAFTDAPTHPEEAPARQPEKSLEETVDWTLALGSLKRDPTLRYRECGRSLLRWLEMRTIRKEEMEYVVRVPSHRAAMIATIARACASVWEQIAVELEERAAQDG
jgi:ParB-like chromosome segregation protein Spo0J